MNTDKRICAREGCENEYTPKTHNMKYCTDECCRLATNARIMKDYYKTKDRLVHNIVRYCTICDITKLSRYNPSDMCSACKSGRISAANNAVSDMLRSATIVS